MRNIFAAMAFNTFAAPDRSVIWPRFMEDRQLPMQQASPLPDTVVEQEKGNFLY